MGLFAKTPLVPLIKPVVAYCAPNCANCKLLFITGTARINVKASHVKPYMATDKRWRIRSNLAHF